MLLALLNEINVLYNRKENINMLLEMINENGKKEEFISDDLINKIIREYNINTDETLKNVIKEQRKIYENTQIITKGDLNKTWFVYDEYSTVSFYNIKGSYKSTGFIQMNKLLINLSNNIHFDFNQDNMSELIDEANILLIDTYKYMTVQKVIGLEIKLNDMIYELFNRIIFRMYILSEYHSFKNIYGIKYFADEIIKDLIEDISRDRKEKRFVPYINIDIITDLLNKCSNNLTFFNNNNEKIQNIYKIINENKVKNEIITEQDLKLDLFSYLYENIIFNKVIINFPKYDKKITLYRVILRYSSELIMQIINEFFNYGYSIVRSFLSASIVPFIGGKNINTNMDIFLKINVPANFPLYFLEPYCCLSGHSILNSESTEVVIPYCDNDNCDELSYKLTQIEHKKDYTYSMLSIDPKTLLERSETFQIKYYYEVNLEKLEKPIKLAYFNEMVNENKYINTIPEHISKKFNI